MALSQVIRISQKSADSAIGLVDLFPMGLLKYTIWRLGDIMFRDVDRHRSTPIDTDISLCSMVHFEVACRSPHFLAAVCQNLNAI